MSYNCHTKGGSSLTDEPTILDEAAEIIAGARNQAYGSARESFTRTEKMWGAILHLDRDVTPEEVAMCFVLHKMSRESHSPKRDNRVDMVGYIALLDQVNEQSGDRV